MTKAQEKLYWREWGAVRKADPQADRHQIQKQALGVDYHVPHKEYSNRQFDVVLAAFRAISRPASIEPQLRAQAQPAHRQQHRIHEIQKCLALYVEDVAGYIATVAEDRFGVPADGTFSLDDLSDQETARINWQTKKPETVPSQLEQMLMTLWARVQDMRRDADHTLHQMRILAGVPCACARICRPMKRVMMERDAEEPESVPDLEQAHPGVQDDNPF